MFKILDLAPNSGLHFLGDLVGVHMSVPEGDCNLLDGDSDFVLPLLVGVAGGPTFDWFLLAGDFCLVMSFLIGGAVAPSCDLVRLMLMCFISW